MNEPMTYGFADAAARLGVSESWLRHEAAARRVPFRRMGRQTRFSQVDLDAIVAAHTVPTEPRLRRVLAS